MSTQFLHSVSLSPILTHGANIPCLDTTKQASLGPWRGPDQDPILLEHLSYWKESGASKSSVVV
jgi:hypothetical protein